MDTFPSEKTILKYEKETPDYMYPNHKPYFVICEAQLNSSECDAIIEESSLLVPHNFPGCSALTTEYSRPLKPIFDPVLNCLRKVTETYWGDDSKGETSAYLQTYHKGSSYKMHMDGATGQSRKFTAIVQLTDPNLYSGGELNMYILPHVITIPKQQGTIVIFPFWILHQVLEVTEGIRQTINVGYWGI